jgi:hypothetical protein
MSKIKKTSSEQPITVNRNSFIAWTQGILLDRDSKGSVLVGDDIKNELAEKALKEGKPIWLTDGGKIISQMKLDINGFQETLININKKTGE